MANERFVLVLAAIPGRGDVAKKLARLLRHVRGVGDFRVVSVSSVVPHRPAREEDRRGE